MSPISSAIGEAFGSLSADSLLVWNYRAIAILAFLAGVGFWFSFGGLDKEEDQVNSLQQGHLHAAEVDPRSKQ
jgi:POT family proton-dependent oligopeptide transporter